MIQTVRAFANLQMSTKICSPGTFCTYMHGYVKRWANEVIIWVIYRNYLRHYPLERLLGAVKICYKMISERRALQHLEMEPSDVIAAW